MVKKALFRTFRNFFKNAPRRSGPSETGFRDLLDELYNFVYTVKNRFWAKCHSLFLSPICETSGGHVERLTLTSTRNVSGVNRAVLR